MDKTVLKHPLFGFKEDTDNSYGGDQWWFSSKRLQGYGCGVIACANIITQCIFTGPGLRHISREDYIKEAGKLTRFYIPVIPRFGVNGVFMSFGINLYFLFHRLPYRAFWGVSVKKRDIRIEEMLKANIPVCLAIGPNFPNLFGRHQIDLYRKEGDGYVPDCRIKAHYVSVTAMDEEWYEISSWGRRLYINRQEYSDYLRKHSCRLFTNILVVKEKG